MAKDKGLTSSKDDKKKAVTKETEKKETVKGFQRFSNMAPERMRNVRSA